ncbi:uncharacterized protein [Nicotiana tomentosiformis]|uniref:uncharacterized protein n=1 Tax=Nicotiana tomentosiformis TaxID=4098 RepID=UPI00388CC43D
MVLAPVAPSPAQPARGGGQASRGGGQLARGRSRGGGQSGGAQTHFYAFLARLEAESSDAIITGIVPVCHRNASILFDPGYTYSFMSSYFASYLVMPCDSLSAPVYVSMPVGDSIIVDHVYHSCVVSIGSLDTSVNLLLLDMIDFDIILSMDWLSPYHAILDCHTKMMTLAISGLTRLKWRETHRHSTSRVISYVKARHMAGKGCLAYLAYIFDSSVEATSMDSVLVVHAFLEVFPTNLLGMPPDRDIDFYFDLAPSTQPISIPPYRMALAELNELKEQLQDLLDKGFIRPIVSPWGHVVSYEGIKVDPKKIEAVQNWPRPTSAIVI